MTTVKLAYYKHFGNLEVQQIKREYERQNSANHVQLLPLSHDQIKEALDKKEIAGAIIDSRDQNYSSSYREIDLTSAAIVVLLQSGNFMSGQQTIELQELTAIPNLLIAKAQEESEELNYHRDQLKIKSPFLAVDSFNEAALMAESGSGYFLMNERTARLINNDQLQKMFLLNHSQQLKQKYVLLINKNSAEEKLVEICKKIFNC